MLTSKNLRRTGLAALTAAVAFTGIGFSANPALADDIVTSSTSTDATSNPHLRGKLAIHYGSGYYTSITGENDTNGRIIAAGHPSAEEALEASAMAIIPSQGSSAPVRVADKCLSMIDLGYDDNPLTFVSCTGDSSQMWTLTEDAVLKHVESGRSVRFAGGWATPSGYASASRSDSIYLDSMHDAFTGSIVQVDLHSRSAELNGFGTPGATVILNETEAVEVESDGTWSYTLLGLKLGDNSITIAQYDGDNNKTDEITLDVPLTVAPITAATTFLPDVSKNLVITGTAQAGADIEIWQGQNMLRTVPAADVTGHFSADVAAPNAAGKQTYTIKQTIDGETAVETYDLTADFGTAASIVTPSDSSAHNGGALRFQGRGVAGAQVALTEQGKSTVIGTATVLANGIWTIDAANIPGKDATYVATQTGRGNNVTTATVRLNPGVNNEALTVATPAQNGTVNPGTVTFTGTANAGATINLVSNVSGASLGQTTADPAGNWSVDVNRTLGAGKYIIKVQNGGLEVTRSFEVKTTPVADSLDVLTPAQDATVAAGTVTFTGTSNPHARIDLISNVSGASLGRTTADAAGAWTVNVNRQLGKGDYKIIVQNGSLEVTRSFQVKAAPVADALDVATPAQGATVAPGTVTFTGTANPNANIRIVSNVTGTLLGTGTANPAGDWTIDINRQLGVDSYNFRVINGSLTVDRAFNVKNPVVPVLDVQAPAQGQTVAAGTVTFTGTANADATIELVSNVTGTSLGSTTADSNGNWSVDVNRNLGPANYVIVVKNDAVKIDRAFQVR